MGYLKWCLTSLRRKGRNWGRISRKKNTEVVIRLLTLPKSIRQQLNISVGDYLDVTIETGNIVLQKVDIIPKKKPIGKTMRRYGINTQPKDSPWK